MQNSQAQKIKAGSAVHLAFNEFEPINLALCLPTAPLGFQGSPNSVIVLQDPGRKGFEARNAAVCTGLQPYIKRGRLLLTYHSCQLLYQFVYSDDDFVLLDPRQIPFLLLT